MGVTLSRPPLFVPLQRHRRLTKTFRLFPCLHVFRNPTPRRMAAGIYGKMVVGAVAGQVTLLGFMLERRRGVLQVSFLIPLPIVVLYLAGR